MSALRRVNRGVALVAGAALLLTAIFILAEIALRQAGASVGGSDEIAGYAMAAITVWGFSYALTERAHVRIDLLRGRVATAGRALFDMAALLSLAFVAVVVAYRAWPVLWRSIENASRANTPLETPLWIPQAIWFAGLVWFALVASLMVAVAAAMIFASRFGDVERLGGRAGEGE